MRTLPLIMQVFLRVPEPWIKYNEDLLVLNLLQGIQGGQKYMNFKKGPNKETTTIVRTHNYDRSLFSKASL